MRRGTRNYWPPDVQWPNCVDRVVIGYASSQIGASPIRAWSLQRGQSRVENGLLLGLPSGAMGRQVVEIVDELVELAMKTRYESFWLHDIDGEPTKIVRAVCDADPRAKNERRALGGTALVNLNEAIEFAGGSSMRTPTWRASCRCFTVYPSRGIPEVVSFR
jgi:hypothetical protein